MKALRPAFMLPVVLATGCSGEPTSNPPATSTPTPAPSSSGSAAVSAIAKPSASPASLRKRAGKRSKSAERKAAPRGAYVSLHPKDASGRFVELADDDSCYVVVPKPTPPPRDLNTGERWTDNVPVDCPPEFDDPAWDSLRAGDNLGWDEKSGRCAFVPFLGNPPPPAVEASCPKTLPKTK